MLTILYGKYMYLQIKRCHNAIHYCKGNELITFNFKSMYQYLDSNPFHVQCLDFLLERHIIVLLFYILVLVHYLIYIHSTPETFSYILEKERLQNNRVFR